LVYLRGKNGKFSVVFGLLTKIKVYRKERY